MRRGDGDGDGDVVPIRASFESKTTCLIKGFRRFSNQDPLGPSTSTGFHWISRDRLFLITNWHNVTGLRADTRTPTGTFTPTHLQIFFFEVDRRAKEHIHFLKPTAKEISLYDENDQPTWLEHPDVAIRDIVAIPIDGYDWKGKLEAVNMKKQPDDFEPMAGDDCFIVGYPEGLVGPEGTPIWKRASIATEPEMDFGGRPVFLVDTASRPGMSGSPVFVKVPGLWGQEGARIEFGSARPPYLGYWTKFIGVYAGREADETLGFQLGRIWKRSVLDEIVENGVAPRHPHY